MEKLLNKKLFKLDWKKIQWNQMGGIMLIQIRKVNLVKLVGVKLFLIFFVGIMIFVISLGLLFYLKVKNIIEENVFWVNQEMID